MFYKRGRIIYYLFVSTMIYYLFVSCKILRTSRKSLRLVVQMWLNHLTSQRKTLAMKGSPKLHRGKRKTNVEKSLDAVFDKFNCFQMMSF